MTKPSQVRAELLSPAELDAALAVSPVAYLPLGTLEFHGPHLPIGLDALTAHGLCLAAAQKTGGIVLPPLYQGTGGGHSDYPWTVMMPTGDALVVLLNECLRKLELFGVRTAVLFTGHFADEQLAMIDDIAASYPGSMSVIATSVNRCAHAPIAPDHAGVFETTLLHSLLPELVHPELLPTLSDHPAVDPGGDQGGGPMGLQRHDPAHPLWGIFGPDPRGVDLSQSSELRECLVDWLTELVQAR